MPKEKAPCKCLLIIMTDSVIRINKKNYPQTLLEECKYIQEKIKVKNYINEDLENSENRKWWWIICWKYFNTDKALIVYVNHALLGFYLCQFV